MVEIPDALRSVFSGTVEERDGGYVVEVPASEVEHDAVAVGEAYRVALLEAPTASPPAEQVDSPSGGSRSDGRPSQRSPQQPPVDEGEVREVTIETVGDQGDGIAKVERGYVLIVPETEPGQQPTVEIEQVQENVAFARVVEP